MLDFHPGNLGDLGLVKILVPDPVHQTEVDPCTYRVNHVILHDETQTYLLC